MPRATRREKSAPGDPSPLIFAAGGLLWNRTAPAPLLAVVHRPYYGDWVLPKGKLDPGERFPDAALREVREETWCESELAEFAGVDAYPLAFGTKVVLYWNMRMVRDLGFQPGNETDAIEWLTPDRAVKRLSHAGERELVRGAADAPGRKSLAPRLTDR